MSHFARLGLAVVFGLLILGCGGKPAPTTAPEPEGAGPRPPAPEEGADEFSKAIVGRWRLASGDKTFELFNSDIEFTADGRVLQLQKDAGSESAAWVERYTYRFKKDDLAAIVLSPVKGGQPVSSVIVAGITADRLVLTWPKVEFKRIK